MQSFFNTSEAYVLKELPEMEVKEVNSENKTPLKSYLNENPKGLMVHFWGTWCAPCEKELPDFIKMVKNLENKKVKAILYAINDEEKKIRKFLDKKIGPLPSNIILAIDNESKALERFGTMKVPETFAFNEKGMMVKKFVGPQEWMAPYFNDYLSNLFSLSN